MDATGIGTIIRRLNLRHFIRHRLRTLLTIGGIASGVALVFSIAIINATLLTTFRESVRDLAGQAEIEVAAADAVGLERGAVDRIARVDGVDNVVPVTRSLARVSGPDGERRILVLGITLEFPRLFSERLLPDVTLDPRAPLGMLLAADVASELGVKSGDEIEVETPSGRVSLPVGGTVAGGALQALNGGDVATMLLPAAQQLFEKGRRVDSVYVVVDPRASVGDVANDIDRALGGAAVVGPPGERSQGLERIFAGLGTLLSLAGTVALFVALFVVYNTMSMSIAERRRELSMAMALGATQRQIFIAFLGEALVLGVLSSAAGIASGYLLARVLVEQAVEAYKILPVAGSGPVAVSLSQIALAAGSGIFVSVLGAFLPARRVLLVAPIESLRPEASYEWSRARSLGLSSRAGAILAVGGMSLALVLFVASNIVEHQGILPTAGMISGLVGVTFLLPRIVPRAVEIVRPFVERGFGTIGRIATDALAKNAGRTTFTVAALVLTLGVAIGVGSALGSYESQIERTASALIGAPIYVTAESYSGLTSDQPLPGALRNRLERVDGVKFVYPLRFAFVSIGSDTALMYAVPLREAIEQGATSDLENGGFAGDPEELFRGLEAGGVAVSRFTADSRDLEVGDALALRTPQGEREFDVVAVYDDLVGFDSLYIDYENYVSIWRDDKADEFGILLEAGVAPAATKGELSELVTAEGIPARVQTEDELLDFILSAVEGTFSLGRGIQLAALVVAALTIANTMFTAVFERRWEMGLQRAVGMSASQLRRGVLLEAGVIGLIGGIGGAILGTVSGYLMTQSMEIQFSWSIPFELPLVLIAGSIAAGVVISCAAGWVPSRLAVRVPIVECLRYE